MKTYKTFGIAAVAWAALVGSAALTASAGDIWYIGRAVGGDLDQGTTITPLSMTGDHLVAGQKVRFRFRMLNRDWQNEYNRRHGSEGAPVTNRIDWYLKYDNNNPEYTATPMKVGVWVNGHRKWAEVVDNICVPANDWFTDLICSYTVEAGDFGLLTLSAGNNAEAPYKGIPNSYEFAPSPWSIVDRYTAATCDFTLESSDTQWGIVSAANMIPHEDGLEEPWPLDANLSRAGIYMRTVDFDSHCYDTNGIWRQIAAGSDKAFIADDVERWPSVVVPGGVADGNTMKLYAWTKDENVAYMPNGTLLTFADGTQRHVVTINFNPHDEEVKIPGGIWAQPDATNENENTTEVYLSATPTNIYWGIETENRVLITNFVTQTIQVGPPRPPSLKLLVNGESSQRVTADADSYDVPVQVVLEGVYTNKLTVTVTAEMADAGSTHSPSDFIGIYNAGTDPDPNGTSATIEIPRNGTTGLANLYVKRAHNNDTTAKEKGIWLKVTVDDAARTYFQGGIYSARLYIGFSKPVASLVDSQPVQVDGGVERVFTIKVSDAFGEMDSNSRYTVKWSNTGSGFVDYSDLALENTDELKVPIKYMTGGEFTSKFKVVNQDGQESEEQLVSVQATPPKKIMITPDRESRKYDENETASVTFTLSEPFTLGETGYLFLVPQDADSSNLVECAQFKTGRSIQAGDSSPSLPAEIHFLDGVPSTLQYRAVLRDKQNFDEGVEIGGFSSDLLEFTVSNVVPRVIGVSLANSQPFSAYDEVHQTQVAKGVPATYQVAEFFEPGEFDKTNLVVRWDFYNPSGNWLYTTNTVGDPLEDACAVQYAFPISGTNSVVVRIRDKDMNTFVGDFKFKVSTLAEPTISMTAYHGSQIFLETDTGRDNGRIDLHLNMAATEPLTVRVDIDTNSLPAGVMVPVLNTHYVNFPAGVTDNYFYITDMDGDMAGIQFTFTASVTNETIAPNSGGKTWKEYYTWDPNGFDITVVNADPVIAGSADNTYTNTATLNVPYTIRWGVSDVPADLTNNFIVSWTVQGEGTFDSVLTNTTSASSHKGEFTFSFTHQGQTVRRVTLHVEDKDGGTDERDYYFLLNPQKPLEVIPLVPEVKKGQTLLSQKYARQPGKGAGRVWANGALSKIEGFMQTWNYEPNNMSAYVFGYGYRAGELDNGNLQPVVSLQPGTKLGINETGDQATAAPWYATFAGYDSFFYCWIGSGEEGEESSGQAEGVHLGPIAPAEGTHVLANSGRQKVSLAGEAEDEENPQFTEVTVEAVFSKEWRPKDNVGDINADGIPDVFAVNHGWKGDVLLFEAAGGTLEDGGDLVDLSEWNDDTVSTVIGATASGDVGDFLPSMTSAGSGTLIPNVQSGWALYGQPFTAFMELRGYGDGLNFRSDPGRSAQGPNALGDWIGERDFTDVESNAWATVYGEDPNWTPENRTDPTVDDTDGDGLPDGYEYYFWYRAYVGDPETGDRLTGERFRLEDIAVGEKITSEEIAKMFNPNVKDSKPINERDSDGDGLSDLEEFAMGTNPIHWDTDGDGISDYWEVMRGLNPLVAESNTTTPDTNPDKDYMAWAEVGKDYAVVTLPDGSMFAVPNNGAELGLIQIGDDKFLPAEATNSAAAIAIPVYRYGDAKSTLVPKSRGEWASETKMGLRGNESREFEVFTCTAKPLDVSPIKWGEGLEVEEKSLEDAATTNVLANVTVKFNQMLTLVHEQVRAQYGFDPRTGWHMNVNGYCVDRWDPNLNPVHARRAGNSGLAVNTKAYSNKDEYLLLKYRYFTRGGSSQSSSLDRDLAKDKADYAKKSTAVGGIFSAGTTNPNIRYSDKTYGALETTFEDKKHGADTDSDGVPDGWELYVGFNPNNTKDGIVEVDGDTLALAREYAGTDSCTVYSNAVSSIDSTEAGAGGEDATIYKNHPGNSNGWYNKFFPSDPWSGDTDGDNIDDATEGGSWKNACVLNNAMRVSTGDGNSYTFTFIYGEQEDDGSLCIRGGGMNPCSVDTDFDLLPDPWEMCFAGVRAEGGVLQGASFGESVTTLLRRTDGNPEPNGVYITGGMDATFGVREDNASFTGDAYTNPSFRDPRTGTIRNFDFDQDGLQNFQEYLVQALRHLRYDDCETPLMGSWMPGGSPSSRKFLGFLPMNIMDGESFYAVTKAAGFVGSGAWQFRELGYFARPPHEWDPTALIPRSGSNYDATGYRVMLPPHGLAGGDRMDSFGYASTDPRTWDSDNDNMGDYYEIFHGLNPLLGSIANTQPEGVPDPSCDVISQIYGGPMVIAFWKNAWTGWPMLPQDWLSGDAAYRDIDAMKFPWMIGTAEADADGDGIRNLEEALVVNMTSPQPTHTDPTPLWMTDSTAQNSASFTSQYYLRDEELDLYGWAWSVSGQTGDGASSSFLFSFEENEGYDTDHDWIADGDEQHMTATPTSDPLNFSDPDLRQAIWFPGENSAAVSYSGNFHRLNYASYDLLRQFTVEAWIRPDVVSGRDQVILERSAAYGASTLSNNVAQVRANFRIGIRADGCLFGLFDTSDAVASGLEAGPANAYVLGPEVAQDVWTHVALSFDGKELKLYKDGRVVGVVPTRQIPANGLINFVEDAVPNMANFPVLNNGYKSVPCAIVLGAQALDINGLTLSDKSSWTSYGSFYAGYLDEVRVWDGARTDGEIIESYRKRFSFEDTASMRNEVYEKWVNYGARNYTRNDNDGYMTLPSELVAHYSFRTLPGAADARYVAWEPSGFTKNVRDVGKVEGNNVPGDIYCGWWYGTPVRSTVYKNWRLVPWIPNTVGHLPLMDGSAVDSQYWSESYGGMTVTNELNSYIDPYSGLVNALTKIEFPNTANPYPYYIYTTDRRHHEFKLDQMVEQNILPRGVKDRYAFELRTSIVGSSDLVPIGGAFAKRCDDLWDGSGAADAWAMTGRDNDANGIPDWWENFAVANYGFEKGKGWDWLVTWADGNTMTAREAYLRDLQRGLIPSGSTGTRDTSYTNMADADNDGLPDWWEDLYGIRKENGLDDHDGDGLSNYAEFLIRECFAKYDGFRRVNPTLAQSFVSELNQKAPDYFLRVNQLYLGEMFSDHDLMEDVWEDQFDPDFVSRFISDSVNDPDKDGWSNFAECRANTDPTVQNIPGMDQYALQQFPIPTVALTVVYNGNSTLDKPIYVQAWREGRVGQLPDAMWRIGSGKQSEKYIGINPRQTYALVLGPGTVVPGTVSFDIYDVGSGSRESGTASTTGDGAGWLPGLATDTPDSSDQTRGHIWLKVSSNDVDAVELGSVNYMTGEAQIDFNKLTGTYRVRSSSGSGNDQGKVIGLDAAFYRVRWQSATPMGNKRVTLRLKDSVPATEGTSLGALREGKNTFVAFLDLNSDGTWTPGEPYGVVTGVDVGWSGTSATIELTDNTPQMFRINLRDAVAQQGFDAVNALTDRGVVGNAAAPNVEMNEGTNMPAQTETSVRVRFAVEAINGRRFIRTASSYTFPTAIPYDDRVNLVVNPFLTEKDLFASTGQLDLGWGLLGEQAERLALTASDVQTVRYRVVLGDGSIASALTNNNNCLAVSFINAYDATQPTCALHSQGTFHTQPTFEWSCNSPSGKRYPAFQLRVYTEETGGTLIYDSGARPAPACDENGRYAWTAPIYPDMTTPQGKVFATTNDYWWAVSMLDAKFTNAAPSGASQTQKRRKIRLEASGQLGKITDYGLIRAKVHYFGPVQDALSFTATKLSNMIRVQAFTSPDFTGMPAGEGRVTLKSQIASVSGTNVNAVILGLKPGTYYLRAFIDSKVDGAWSNWESWGYGNYVGAPDAAITRITRGSVVSETFSAAAYPYTPRPYTVAVGQEPPVAEIYIEDMDTDNDGLPDIWEYLENGTLYKLGPPEGATFFTRVNPALDDTVRSYTQLKNASSVGMTYAPITLMNTILSGSSSEVTAAAASLLGGQSENVAVRIDSFSLTDGLALTVSSEVSQTETAGQAIFAVADSANVKVILVAATSPDFADAKETQVKTIAIRANVETREVVTADELKTAIDTAGLGDAAFFKVRLEAAE